MVGDVSQFATIEHWGLHFTAAFINMGYYKGHSFGPLEVPYSESICIFLEFRKFSLFIYMCKPSLWKILKPSHSTKACCRNGEAVTEWEAGPLETDLARLLLWKAAGLGGALSGTQGESSAEHCEGVFVGGL